MKWSVTCFQNDILVFPICILVFSLSIKRPIAWIARSMRLVGLTGGIACGKSTVARVLKQEHKLKVIDVDDFSRFALSPGSPWSAFVRWRVARLFPSAARFDEDGKLVSLDRQEIAHIAFNDASRRKQLNNTIHPVVVILLLSAIIKAYFQFHRVCVIEAALLFETRLNAVCDDIIVCDPGDEQTQVRRVVQRDGVDRAQALAKVRCQMPNCQKTQRGTIIVNTGEASHSPSSVIMYDAHTAATRIKRLKTADLITSPITLLAVSLATAYAYLTLF